jgi:hypothetical protein
MRELPETPSRLNVSKTLRSVAGAASIWRMPGDLTNVLASGAFLTVAEPIAIPLLRHRAIDAPTACDPFAFPDCSAVSADSRRLT